MIGLTGDDRPPPKKRRTDVGSSALTSALARTHRVQEPTIAAVRRLHTVQGWTGYTQGWSWVMAVLLCFGPPEEVGSMLTSPLV